MQQSQSVQSAGRWPLARIVCAVLIGMALVSLALGAAAYALAENSPAAAPRGVEAAAWAFLPALVLAMALIPGALSPQVRFGEGIRRARVIAWILIFQLMWWMAVGLGFVDSREVFPSARALARELSNLASQQEIYHLDGGGYGETLDEVYFRPSLGRIVRMEGTPSGWSAIATYERRPDFSCAVYMGTVARPLAVANGDVPAAPGEVLCDPRVPGPFGRWLLRFHFALRHRFALSPFS